MALVNNISFENWTSSQVAEWLKGLDDGLLPYVEHFITQDVNGRKLMMLTHHDLEKIGINKLGHQELILEAVDLLKALRYNHDTENLQFLALQLGCKARSLYNQIQPKNAENDQNKANSSHHKPRRLSIDILSSVADLIITLKSIVSWFDRAPFEGMYDMGLLRNTIIKLGMDLISACQRDAGDYDAEESIVKSCHLLADYCEDLMINNRESLMVQPASLESAVIRKKPVEELGMHIQSAYYGIHVIGGIKDMSPADLCGKIEKGDEVIQVNQKIVVGWQLKKLVNTLKEKPKEVSLLLKKRPHHVSPYGQPANRKRPLKGLHPNQVATLPKSLKKRRSRDGEHPKQTRPSLQEFVSSIPSEDLYSPKEERVSDEKDDENDTDNDVFRSGSESPQYTLPVVVDPKQRRATVSGGSPTLSRPLLVIDDLDTPTRPKSFAVASVDAPQTDIMLPVEDSLMKSGSAQQKRQEFKAPSSVPQSLEFTVKKPVPVVQEPQKDTTTLTASQEHQRMLQELLEQKKALDLLEVPSRFQNPNRKNVESEKGEPADQTVSEENGSDNKDKKASSEGDDRRQDKGKGDDRREDKGKGDSDEKSNIVRQTKEHKVSGEPEKGQSVQTESTDIKKDEVVTNKEQSSLTEAAAIAERSTEQNKSMKPSQSVGDLKRPDLDSVTIRKAKLVTTSSVDSIKSHIPQTAPKDLEAAYWENKKVTKTNSSSEVALNTREKSEPQLVKIRKIESMKLSDMDLKESGIPAEPKKVTFGKDCKPDEAVSTGKGMGLTKKGMVFQKKGHDAVPCYVDLDSTLFKHQFLQIYTTIVAGGVVQKIPIQSGSSNPTMEHVVMRKKKIKKKVDRRISCKDLGRGDCEGWLYKKRDKGHGLLSKHWLKRWFVLKQSNLFFYKDKEDLKAEGVLHMPAFQVSPAPEVKTKKFAFKVHNLGTAFVFASERQDDMSKWMNKMGLAAIHVSPPRVIKTERDEYYSESDDEQEPETGSQRSTPEREVPAADSSNEDLTALMRNIHNENLTIDGKDKTQQRRSTMAGATGTSDLPSQEEVEKIKKVHSLKRTLKAKEIELLEIEKLLTDRVTHEMLQDYVEQFSVPQKESSEK